MYVTIVAAGLASLSNAGLALPVHPQKPTAYVFEGGGYGTDSAFARARVSEESAAAWCDNWRPDDDDCAAVVLSNEHGKVYEAKANCQTGSLISTSDDEYVWDGFWRNSHMGLWEGQYRFKRATDGTVVQTSNADGGITLAAQWRLLCPLGTPYDIQPGSSRKSKCHPAVNLPATTVRG